MGSLFFFFQGSGNHRNLHSFPTRRSSDLKRQRWRRCGRPSLSRRTKKPGSASALDRKSTRLNSSHTVISYAVFCLKKKKKDRLHTLSKQVQTAVKRTCGSGSADDNRCSAH